MEIIEAIIIIIQKLLFCVKFDWYEKKSDLDGRENVYHAGLQVLRSSIFWDITPCSPLKKRIRP
jgi:hypothetical protein